MSRPVAVPDGGPAVAVVSGASSGIGFGIADVLAAAGARVAMLARTSDAIEGAARDIGERATAYTVDITDPGQVERAGADIEQRLGPVDLVVHNAGTAKVIGPLWTADPDAWWAEVAGHLRGAMLLAHACLPSMIERGSGRLVLVYGNLGAGGDPWSTAFAAGKAGLARLVEQLHAELTDTGVRVFGLHPGLVWTPTTAAFARDEELRRWLPRFAEAPRERFGTARPAAELVLRIARGEADPLSGLLLGADDDVDGLVAQAEQLRDQGRRVLRVDD